MRLNPQFRFALYAVFAGLFLTGIGWLWANQMKDGSSGEAWQTAMTYLMTLHGGAAMAALMLLGAIIPLHAQRAWRSDRNRPLGAIMLAFNGVLVATAFGLYYAGSDVLRSGISDIHIGFGVGLPALWLVHVVVGRRSS